MWTFILQTVVEYINRKYPGGVPGFIGTIVLVSIVTGVFVTNVAAYVVVSAPTINTEDQCSQLEESDFDQFTDEEMDSWTEEEWERTIDQMTFSSQLSSGTSTEAKMTSQAQKIYSILAGTGMSNTNIAGILGNWQAESGIDATIVQGFTPTYAMSSEKQEAAKETANGIGLGQWTGGRNTNLRNYAEAKKQNWWSLDTQLAFMFSKEEGSNADIVRGMVSNEMGSPGEAALYFHDKWERSADTKEMVQRRADYADEWFALMSTWTVTADTEFGQSLLSQSSTVVTAANTLEYSNCSGGIVSATLTDGGLDLSAAQAIADTYNNVDGKAVLNDLVAQGTGAPGTCNSSPFYGDITVNCVSLSNYFIYKYTTVDYYINGNGRETAGELSRDTGIPMTNTPVAYSVASGRFTNPGSSAAGHTFIVVGVEGDDVIAIEAGWCAYRGRVRVYSAEYLMNLGFTFTPLNSIMVDAPETITTGT